MTCIVTIKGKKFYKDDFIHMVLDTMKITPEEISGNEYLKKINYTSEFGMGDPLGIRKKPEGKDPVKDVVTLADKFNKLSKGKKKQSSENTTNLRNKITQQAKDQGLEVEFRRGNGKEKVVLTKDGKKINNIKAGNEFFTASEFDAGDVVYDKSKNTLKYRVLENGDLKDIKTGKVITPEENQLFGLSKSAYMDEYLAAKKAVLGKEAETVEEAIMQAFASGARIRWRSKMKAGKDGLGDLLGGHMSKEATGFRLGKDKIYDSVDDFLTGIKEGIEWDDGKARTAIAELIQKYDSPAKMLEALIELRGEKKVINKEGEWEVQKSPDEIAFEEQVESIKERHKIEEDEVNALIKKFGDIDEAERHLKDLQELDHTPEITELVDESLLKYADENGDINIKKLVSDLNDGTLKLDNEIINNIKELTNESIRLKENETPSGNGDVVKVNEDRANDPNKEKGGTQAGVKAGSVGVGGDVKIKLPKGAKEVFHYSENESLNKLEDREGGTWFTDNGYGYQRRLGVKGKVSKVIELDKLNLATEKQVWEAGEGDWANGVKKIKEQGFDGVKQTVDGDKHYLVFDLKNIKDKSDYESKKPNTGTDSGGQKADGNETVLNTEVGGNEKGKTKKEAVEQPDTTPPEKPLNEPVNKAKTPVELAKEKYLAAKEKANKLRDQSNLGTIIDPFKKVKDQAIADRETLDMLVNLITEHIKEGNRNIKEFAASIGEKVEDIKKAWDIAEKGEVYGIKVAMLDDAVRDALHDFGDRRTLDEVRLESIRKVVAGEIIPKNLVDKINSREKYIPSGEDILALIEYKVSLENERTKYKKELDNATTDNAKSVAQDKLNDVNDRLFDWSKASSISAADMSQGFRFRQLMMDNEFNAVNEIRQWKANDKNGEIPQEMVELIKKNEQEIKDLNNQLKDLEVKTKEKEEQWAIERMKAEAAQTAAKTPARKSVLTTEKLARLQELDKLLLNKLNNFDEALKFLFTKDGREWLSLVFEEAVGDFKVFAKDLVKKLGKEVAPHLKDLYKEAGGTDKGVYDSYKPEMKTDKSGASKLVIPHNLIRALVESGIDNIEGITTAVHNMVKGDLPGITETQVRDAITEYGKKRYPNPDVIEGKIRKAKEIGKLLSSKELLGKGLNALRSGFQRDKPTPKARALMKEIRKMQKLLPKTETDIKNAWATALDKAKNSLKNQIEDLDNAITTEVALVKSDGTKLIPDAEIMSLTERRDLLKEKYDATFGKEASELTESERIDAAIAALERDSEKLVAAIKKGQIEYKKTKPLGLAKRLDQARAKNKLIKEVLADLRKESGLSLAKEIELRKDAAVKYIIKQDERIKNKDFGTTKREEFFSDDPEWLNIQKQKRKIKEDFEVEKEIHRLNNMNFYEKAGMYALDAVGTLPKVMSLGLDLSAAFIQGLPNVMRREWRTAFNKQFEFLAKEKNYNEWLANLRSSSFYNDWVVRHKLFVSEQGLKQRARDESFNSPLFDLTVGKIPVVGGAYRATERAFVGFGNVARVERFRRQVKDQLDLGFSPEKVHEWADDLAKITNNEYGRANYAKWAEGGAGIYASLLTAPRYVLSLFNTTMNPLYFAKLKGPARTQAMVHWFRMAGIVSGTMLAIKAANKVNSDIDIITDPNSNDFGKIVYKGLYMDGLSKLVQFPRLATQLLSSYTSNGATGEKTELSGNFGGKSWLSVLGRYSWGKTAPVPNLVISALNGSDLAGDKVGPKNLGGLITPLSAKNIYEIAKLYEYQTAAAAAIPILFGQGISARPDVRVINEYTLDAEMGRMNEIKNRPFETTAAKKERLKKEKIKEKNKEQSFINAAKEAGRESEYRKLKKDVEKKQEENK